MTRALIKLILCCTVMCGVAHAQNETAEEWRHYQVDELVSVSFPGEMPKNMNWVDSSYRTGDSTFCLAVRVVDLSEEIATMPRMKENELSELVYQTEVEKMSRHTKFNVQRKLWRWKKHNFDMLMWYPFSSTESQFYNSIRTFPWGPDMNNQILPPFTRYDRMLFYNNKLYIFSMLAVSVAYRDREYYEHGGRTEVELRELKEKFFRSIDVRKAKR